jgi:hypothetical protein
MRRQLDAAPMQLALSPDPVLGVHPEQRPRQPPDPVSQTGDLNGCGGAPDAETSRTGYRRNQFGRCTAAHATEHDRVVHARQLGEARSDHRLGE